MFNLDRSIVCSTIRTGTVPYPNALQLDNAANSTVDNDHRRCHSHTARQHRNATANKTAACIVCGTSFLFI